MTALLRFRIFALLIAVFVGGIASMNLAAEFVNSTPMPLPSGTSNPTPQQISSAALAATIAPFRSDLMANYASGLASQTLRSNVKANSEGANAVQNAVKSALAIGPHDSRMWLVLALVQAENDPADPHIAEFLKMSYLTGPNQADLIPVRMDAVTKNNALNDPDLGDLARSDVRALLTQLPNQHQALVDDYTRASPVGKKFLEDSVATEDPGFASQLQKK